jgi:hypothetical protein
MDGTDIEDALRWLVDAGFTVVPGPYYGQQVGGFSEFVEGFSVFLDHGADIVTMAQATKFVIEKVAARFGDTIEGAQVRKVYAQGMSKATCTRCGRFWYFGQIGLPIERCRQFNCGGEVEITRSV